MKLLIQVTKDDIKRGVRKDCKCCPVALAIRRHLLLANVIVGKHYATLFTQEGLEKIANFSEETMNRIADFDRRGEMIPFSFELEID
jgi:hypothetical protein